MHRLEDKPTKIDQGALHERVFNRRVCARSLADERPRLVRVVEAVRAIPAVALVADPGERRDQRGIERVRAEARVGQRDRELRVAAIVVDVRVGDQHFAHPVGRDPERCESWQELVPHGRTRDPAVNDRDPVTDAEPLAHRAAAQVRADLVDPGCDLQQAHRASASERSIAATVSASAARFWVAIARL